MIQNRNPKIILLGDTCTYISSKDVGKTSILNRLINESFNIQIANTIGACSMEYTCKLSQNKSITMDIWDTAGQQRYRSLLTMYYTNSDVIIIVFDVTKESTFDTVESWSKQINEKCRNKKKIILVGNKYDQKNKMKIKQQKINKYRKEKGWDFFYCSALDNYNIQEIFIQAGKLAMEIENEKNDKSKEKSNRNGIKLGTSQKKSSCC